MLKCWKTKEKEYIEYSIAYFWACFVLIWNLFFKDFKFSVFPFTKCNYYYSFSTLAIYVTALNILNYILFIISQFQKPFTFVSQQSSPKCMKPAVQQTFFAYENVVAY